MAGGKTRAIGWVLGIALVGGATLPAFGQAKTAGGGAASRPTGTSVAVVDLARIFKNHPQVKQQVEAMKQELTDYEKEVIASRQSISKQREQMARLEVGTPAYKQADEQITRQMSDLQVRDQLKKKEVLEREARIYYDMYDEVQGEVARLANEFGIGLVIRFDSQPIEPTDRNSVQAGVMRNVVFQRNLDLTPLILERLGVAATPAVKQASNTSPATKPTTNNKR